MKSCGSFTRRITKLLEAKILAEKKMLEGRLNSLRQDEDEDLYQ
jgi:hypothetical protein